MPSSPPISATLPIRFCTELGFLAYSLAKLVALKETTPEPLTDNPTAPADTPLAASPLTALSISFLSSVAEKLPRSGPAVAVADGPGMLLQGQVAHLVDRGYQKFLRTSKIQVAATAARLHALHAFDEELYEAIGTPDYYNLALGTVSDLYLYDRVKGREEAPKASAETH